MDSAQILGAVELGLIGRQDGEDAAHGGDGEEGGGAEADEGERGCW